MKRRTFLRASAVASVVGFAGCLGDAEYTVSNVQVDESSGPLGLSVTVMDSDATVEGPARFGFSLRNPTQEAIRVRSTAVWPFGVLSLTMSPPRTASATRSTATQSTPEITLYSPNYTESGNVTVSASRNSMTVDGVRITRRLDPGETARTLYLLHGNEIYTTGTHYVAGWTGLKTSQYMTNGEWSRLPLAVAIDIERQNRFVV